MLRHPAGLWVQTSVVNVARGGKSPLQPESVLSWTEHEMVLPNYEDWISHYLNSQPEKVKQLPALGAA